MPASPPAAAASGPPGAGKAVRPGRGGATPAGSREAPAGRLGVLLADPLLRAVTVRRLELLGYAVVPLPEDLAAAPVVAADGGAGGVLIDLDLPDAAALRIVERLSADDATAGLPVLGLVGETPQGLLEEAFAGGVTDLLIVPYDPLVLEAKVAALLANARGPAAAGPAAPKRAA